MDTDTLQSISLIFIGVACILNSLALLRRP